jgi:hypothetical protein
VLVAEEGNGSSVEPYDTTCQSGFLTP